MSPEQRRDIVPGLVLFNPFQNARTDEMIADWKEERRTPFNDVIYEFGRSVGHKIATDPKTQVALVAFMVGAAAALAWRLNNRKPEVIAGHSFGENASLKGAGILPIDKVAQIVQAREEICKQSSSSLALVERGMAAISRLSPGDADRLIEFIRNLRKENIMAEIANLNSSTQLVLTGFKSHIEEAVNRFIAENQGNGKRPLLTYLPGLTFPYHASFNVEEEAQLKQAVQAIGGGYFQDPVTRVYSPMQKAETDNGWVVSGRQAQVIAGAQLRYGVNFRGGLKDVIGQAGPKVLATSDPTGRMDKLIKENLQEMGVDDEIEVVNFSTPQRLEKAALVIEEKCAI